MTDEELARAILDKLGCTGYPNGTDKPAESFPDDIDLVKGYLAAVRVEAIQVEREACYDIIRSLSDKLDDCSVSYAAECMIDAIRARKPQ